MKNLLLSILAFTIFVACTEQENTQQSERKQNPNVLIILTDDQGWGDLHFHGNDSIDTPVLDEFAQNSIYLDRFYVSPVCAPTRAAMLTGRYPMRTGVTGVTNRREVMREEEVTIAELLKASGYQTGMFGKWHNGEQYPNNPKGQGFDEFFGFTAGHWNNYFNTTLNYNGEMVETKGYINNVLTDSAIHFITKNQQNPFLCYMAYNTPHSPFQLPDEYFEKYKAMGFNDKNASVYGMVENIDDNVGRFFNVLDSLDIAENTIVLFFTDNGPNGHRYNGSMKGVKGWVDEGGIRVPFFLRYPARYPNPKKINQIAAHIDIMPTILSLCDIVVPDSLSIDGVSLSPLFDQTAVDWEDRFIFTNWGGKGAVRNQRFRMVVQNRDTLLYDMYHDPGQHLPMQTDLVADGRAMKIAYDSWLAEVKKGSIAPPPIPIGYQEALVVSLPAHEATLHSGLQYKEGHGWANDWIVNWTEERSYATWPIKVVQDGEYAIALLYDTTEGQEGSEVEVTLGDKVVSTVIAEPFSGRLIESPDRVERKEVYEKEWGNLQVGTLQLESGEYQLKVQATEIANEYAMELKGLIINKIQ